MKGNSLMCRGSIPYALLLRVDVYVRTGQGLFSPYASEKSRQMFFLFCFVFLRSVRNSLGRGDTGRDQGIHRGARRVWYDIGTRVLLPRLKAHSSRMISRLHRVGTWTFIELAPPLTPPPHCMPPGSELKPRGPGSQTTLAQRKDGELGVL